MSFQPLENNERPHDQKRDWSDALQQGDPLGKASLPPRETHGLAKKLKEVFTPLCSDLATKVCALSPSDLEGISRSFSTGTVHVPNFLNGYFSSGRPDRLVISTALIGSSGIQKELSFLRDCLKVCERLGPQEDAGALMQSLERISKIWGSLWREGARWERAVLPEKLSQSIVKVEEAFLLVEQLGIGNCLEALSKVQQRDFLNRIDVMSASAGEQKMAHSQFALATGLASEFIWASNELGAQVWESLTSDILTPVGGYGREFSELLTKVTRILVNLAVNFESEMSSRVTFETPELIAATARGGFRFDKSQMPFSPLFALCEGIISINQTLALLMAERVPTYSDPIECLKACVHEVNTIAHLVPMGFVGPLSLRGRYFPQILVPQYGRLELNPELKKKFMEYRSAYREIAVRSSPPPSPRTATGYGCPVAMRDSNNKKSGIDQLCDAFLRIADALT